MEQKQLQANKIILWLFRLAGICAIPILILNAYVDYKIFILFGANLHSFITYTIHDVPFYLFCIGLVYCSFKKFYPFLWLSPIFTFTTLQVSVPYFYNIITNSNTITMPFLTFLAVVNTMFILLTLITWILLLRKYLKSRAKHIC